MIILIICYTLFFTYSPGVFAGRWHHSNTNYSWCWSFRLDYRYSDCLPNWQKKKLCRISDSVILIHMWSLLQNNKASTSSNMQYFSISGIFSCSSHFRMGGVGDFQLKINKNTPKTINYKLVTWFWFPQPRNLKLLFLWQKACVKSRLLLVPSCWVSISVFSLYVFWLEINSLGKTIFKKRFLFLHVVKIETMDLYLLVLYFFVILFAG